MQYQHLTFSRSHCPDRAQGWPATGYGACRSEGLSARWRQVRFRKNYRLYPSEATSHNGESSEAEHLPVWRLMSCATEALPPQTRQSLRSTTFKYLNLALIPISGAAITSIQGPGRRLAFHEGFHQGGHTPIVAEGTGSGLEWPNEGKLFKGRTGRKKQSPSVSSISSALPGAPLADRPAVSV